MDEVDQNQENQHFLTLLEALKKASKVLQTNPFSLTNKNSSKTTIEALSWLEAEVATILPANPTLYNLSQLLRNLKTLLLKLENSQGYSLRSLLACQITNYKISQIACAIEAEIQAYIDRESVQNLAKMLKESVDESKMVKVLTEFQNRVSQSFDGDFQDMVLRAKIFSILESILCDSTCSRRVRDQSALVIDALVRFNKTVFVGLVFMGPTIQALISIASCCSIQVLSSLIKSTRTPLVDEIESNGEIPSIISLLSSEDLSTRVAALDCILALAYFGRKEVIESMLKADLIEKLMELQRLEKGSDLIDEAENGGEVCVVEVVENYYPFESCVTRFAVQLEVGEVLSKTEKTEFKLEILRIVREASVSDAESATTEAEVLWGSSP